jgi:tetratricopeptide (TPR) repeat protein
METENLAAKAEAINKIGDKLMKKKQFNEAIAYYKDSVDLMKMAGNTKRAENFEKELETAIAKRAAELNSMGDNFFKNKNYKQAVDTYQEAWDLLQNAGEKWTKKYGKEFTTELKNAKTKFATEILLPQAVSLSYNGKWDESIAQLHDILEEYKEDLDQKSFLLINNAICEVHNRWADSFSVDAEKAFSLKKNSEALEKYTQAYQHYTIGQNMQKRAVIEKSLVKLFKENAEQTKNHALSLINENKYEEAIALMEECIKLAESLNDKKYVDLFKKELDRAYDLMIKKLKETAEGLAAKWKYEDAANMYFKALQIAKESNRKRLAEEFTKEYNTMVWKWADKILTKANELEAIGDYEMAIVNYQDAINTIKNSYDQQQIKEFSQTIYRIYLTIAEKLKARGEALFAKNSCEKAYENVDLCVHLAELANNPKKMNEFRKLRDKIMEKLQIT